MYGPCYRVFCRCDIPPNHFVLASFSDYTVSISFHQAPVAREQHVSVLFSKSIFHFIFHLGQPMNTIELADNVKSLRGAKSKGRLLTTILDAFEFFGRS
jgi:hypothetical protein